MQTVHANKILLAVHDMGDDCRVVLEQVGASRFSVAIEHECRATVEGSVWERFGSSTFPNYDAAYAEYAKIKEGADK